MLNCWPKWCRIAELGVFKGEFSAEILKRCEPLELHLVDLFQGKYQSANLWADMGDEYERLKELYQSSKIVRLVKSDSIRWLLSVPPGSLDIVYIDSSHMFEDTLFELFASRIAVKKGGLICGHDYVPQWGVIRAVTYFCTRMNLMADIWASEPFPSFCIPNLQ
jgi:hypothetical protein